MEEVRGLNTNPNIIGSKMWDWKKIEKAIGGPNLLILPDGRYVAGLRFYNPERTSLAWYDWEAGSLNEFLALPSGGDNSYPGLLWRDGLLWISYYSSHSGKAKIYLAKVSL